MVNVSLDQHVVIIVIAWPRWLIRIDWACNPVIPGSNPGRAGYLSLWLCIYFFKTDQRHGVCSAAYGTVHYK